MKHETIRFNPVCRFTSREPERALLILKSLIRRKRGGKHEYTNEQIKQILIQAFAGQKIGVFWDCETKNFVVELPDGASVNFGVPSTWAGGDGW